ncbi:TPA: hypothetical protein SFZ43_000044 [Campylobacter jejuni]|nr:hypothetical protein [Campylobacter jejuni]
MKMKGYYRLVDLLPWFTVFPLACLMIIAIWLKHGWIVSTIFTIAIGVGAIGSLVGSTELLKPEQAHLKEGWALDEDVKIGLVNTYYIMSQGLEDVKTKFLNEKKNLEEKLEQANERPEVKRKGKKLEPRDVSLLLYSETETYRFFDFVDVQIYQLVTEKGLDRYLNYTNDKLDDMLRNNDDLRTRNEKLQILTEALEAPKGESEMEIMLSLPDNLNEYMDDRGLEGLVDDIFNLPDVRKTIDDFKVSNEPLKAKEIQWQL